MSDIKYLTSIGRHNPRYQHARVADKIRDDKTLQARLLRRLRIAMPAAEARWTGYEEYDLLIDQHNPDLKEASLDKLNQLLYEVEDDFVLDAQPGNHAMEVLVACRYPVSKADAKHLLKQLQLTPQKWGKRFVVFRVSLATPSAIYGDLVLSVLVTSHQLDEAATLLLDEAKNVLSLKIDL